MPNKDKNPAAVALGKRRYETMTDEQREAFFRGRDQAHAKRTPAERSALARRSAMTRRIAGPAWLRKKQSDPSAGAPPAELAADLAQLDRAIDELPDDLLSLLLDRIAGRTA
jgi:hypothetical protein